MKSAFRDVLLFHKKFRPHLIGKTPKIPDQDLCALRMRLVREEYTELSSAYLDNKLEDLADSIVDLIYVLIGMAISYGIDLSPLWEEVQDANMRKQIENGRPDGKVSKPEGWIPPDIKGILDRQQTIEEIYF
jgi:predicted HAD superfamily Cof-like phosphohydrolase